MRVSVLRMALFVAATLRAERSFRLSRVRCRDCKTISRLARLGRLQNLVAYQLVLSAKDATLQETTG